MYVHSMEHRAVYWTDVMIWRLRITSIWKLESTLVHRVTVEIALGDHRGHELSLSLETWKGLYEQQWNIYKMLRNEYKDNFISIGPLIVSVCTLNDARTSRFFIRTHYDDRNDTTTYVWVWRITVMFERLARLIDTVDVVKYTRFFNIASENAIRDSNIFNRHQLVDCEVLILAFNTKKKETI